jgi:chromosome segregation protein
MRLSAIKLAGFKSFVEPTILRLPDSLTAIVGPNGCGKSNVIDAMRWVLGETNARVLRGEGLADVIFNGARGRKPVGRAVIELFFDNSDGALGGEYAGFSEIAVKRELVRDGNSHYYLNGSRCRRRDITDIFLGTGLGSRSSYAIIEQGTISRLVEARPEDVRLIIEEAAGISKYRERRRETENRLRHTRDNLERLEDLRGELEERLARLKRQADNAEKYKRYKAEERRLKAELLALRYRELAAETARQRDALESAEAAARRAREQVREAGETEAHLQNALDGAARSLQDTQGEFYAAEAEVARAEQSLKHARELQQMHERERAAAQAQYAELRQRSELEDERAQSLEAEMAGLEKQLGEYTVVVEQADGALAEAEENLAQAQQAWEETSRDSQQPRSRAEGERARVEALERSLAAQRKRQRRLLEENERLGAEDENTDAHETAEEECELAQAIAQMEENQRGLKTRQARLRGERSEAEGTLHEVRQALQSDQGRLSSLEALARADACQDGEGLAGWLQARGLGDAPRLARHITVEPGWERAVETALGEYLHGLCTDNLYQRLPELNQPPQAALALMDASAAAAAGETLPAPPGLTSLAGYVSAPAAVTALLANAYGVSDFEKAVETAPALGPGQLLVTPEGCCIGQGFIYWPGSDTDDDGVLEREKAMQRLRLTLEQHEVRRDDLQARQEELAQALAVADKDQESVEARLRESRGRLNEMVAERQARNAHLARIRARARALAGELEETQTGLKREETELAAARGRLQSAETDARRLEGELERKGRHLKQIRAELGDKRRAREEAAQTRQKLELALAEKRVALNVAKQAMESLSARLEQARQAQRDLDESGQDTGLPVAERETAVVQAGEKRERVRAELESARQAHDKAQSAVEAQRGRMQSLEAARERTQEALQRARIQEETLAERRRGLEGQIGEVGFQPEELVRQLDAEAEITAWEGKLQRLDRRVQRLGPINLAAIQEYEELSERSRYLNSQHEDLTQALESLEKAIRRIDRETRSRFRATFDKVNNGFGALFPRLFGGGEASLEMTGEDLLDTGIRVMARPPGKRNTSIHLLSGGEKAMTAVALVFALFELNPAPFCILDEVDAPLDDANIGRFCELVRDWSARVQFILITHNKITMELANRLHGVTMHEPGVSRLVSVDVEKAVSLAGQ